jgi:hypothetical protein
MTEQAVTELLTFGHLCDPTALPVAGIYAHDAS